VLENVRKLPKQPSPDLRPQIGFETDKADVAFPHLKRVIRGSKQVPLKDEVAALLLTMRPFIFAFILTLSFLIPISLCACKISYE